MKTTPQSDYADLPLITDAARIRGVRALDALCLRVMARYEARIAREQAQPTTSPAGDAARADSPTTPQA